MSDGAGTSITDYATTPHDATLSGNPEWDATGLEFDGIDDYADVGDPVVADTDDFTVIAGITKRTGGNWYVIRGEDDGADPGDGWSSDIGSFGAHVVTVSPEAQTDAYLGADLNPGDRRVIAMAVELGTSITYYRDGESLDESLAGKDTLRSSTVGFRFGITNHNAFQAGHIEFVYIWRKALTTVQIAEIMASPYLLFEPTQELPPEGSGIIFARGHLLTEIDGESIEFGDLQDSAISIEPSEEVDIYGPDGSMPLDVQVSDYTAVLSASMLRVKGRALERLLGAGLSYSGNETTLSIDKLSLPETFSAVLKTPSDGSDIEITIHEVMPRDFSIPFPLRDFSVPGFQADIVIDDTDRVYDIKLPGYQTEH
jgi:hypothetical protein